MGQRYTVQFTGVAVSAQQDLFALVSHVDKVCVLREIYISQLSELGDIGEEQLHIGVKSGQTTAGSGGTSPAPVPCAPVQTGLSERASSFTARVNDTTKASAGTILKHHSECWNVRFPFRLKPDIQFSRGRRLTIELSTTPADVVTMDGTVYVEEIG